MPAAPASRPRLDAPLLASVWIGGVVGTLARAGISEWTGPVGGGWPWGTFAANLAGTAVLAVVAATLTAGRDPRWRGRGVLGTGFCGALTTFATMQVEIVDLVRDGRPGTAVAYALASVGAGLAIAVAILRAVRV